jgi:hypothetical protein
LAPTGLAGGSFARLFSLGFSPLLLPEDVPLQLSQDCRGRLASVSLGKGQFLLAILSISIRQMIDKQLVKPVFWYLLLWAEEQYNLPYSAVVQARGKVSQMEEEN